MDVDSPLRACKTVETCDGRRIGRCLEEDTLNDENNEPKVVESASATTSRDNENSGPFAYIITAVALGVLLLFSVVGAGCMSIIFTSAAVYRGDGTSGTYGTMSPDYNRDLDFDDYFDDELEEILERYADPTRTHGTMDSSKDKDKGENASGSENDAAVSDVLDFNIAPYEPSIEAGVSATSYAGVPEEVHTFVRSVVTTDSTNTKELVVYLDNAAKMEDVRAEKIAAAKQLCSSAKASLGAFEVPSADVIGGDAAEKLSVALGKAQERWNLLEQEIALLDTTGKVDTKKLWELDEQVLQATEDAADKLEDAMYTAAKR
jgi:hypothetical protein